MVVSPKSLIVASEKHLSTLILITMRTKRKETKKGEIVMLTSRQEMPMEVIAKNLKSMGLKTEEIMKATGFF